MHFILLRQPICLSPDVWLWCVGATATVRTVYCRSYRLGLVVHLVNAVRWTSIEPLVQLDSCVL